MGNTLVETQLSVAQTRSIIDDLYLRLRSGWDVDTSHSSCRSIAGPGSPVGQCYVSSMVVAEFLARLGIEASIVRGTVYCHERVIISDHGWVEFSLDDQWWICDLTLGQVMGLSKISMIPRRLTEVDYVSRDRRTLSSVTNLDVWSRFWILSSRVFMREAVDA